MFLYRTNNRCYGSRSADRGRVGGSKSGHSRHPAYSRTPQCPDATPRMPGTGCHASDAADRPSRARPAPGRRLLRSVERGRGTVPTRFSRTRSASAADRDPVRGRRRDAVVRRASAPAPSTRVCRAPRPAGGHALDEVPPGLLAQDRRPSPGAGRRRRAAPTLFGCRPRAAQAPFGSPLSASSRMPRRSRASAASAVTSTAGPASGVSTASVPRSLGAAGASSNKGWTTSSWPMAR